MGEARLKAGKTREAVAAYERALKLTPQRTAALLGLARARQAAGDRAGAAEAYRRLLDNWQRADASLPALQEAKERTASPVSANGLTPVTRRMAEGRGGVRGPTGPRSRTSRSALMPVAADLADLKVRATCRISRTSFQGRGQVATATRRRLLSDRERPRERCDVLPTTVPVSRSITGPPPVPAGAKHSSSNVAAPSLARTTAPGMTCFSPAARAKWSPNAPLDMLDWSRGNPMTATR